MSDDFTRATEQVAAFQKIWMDSFTQFMQGVTPDTASPEVLRHRRASIFQSLARSWDEFLRSPQFLEGMRHWMDSTVTFRKLSNEWMARVRNEFQAPSREDIDSIMLSVRHMEQRLLDRVEQLAKRIEALDDKASESQPAKGSNKAPRPSPARNRRRTPASRAKPATL